MLLLLFQGGTQLDLPPPPPPAPIVAIEFLSHGDATIQAGATVTIETQGATTTITPGGRTTIQ